MQMIANGFIVEEAVFSLIFFALGCLFVLQLFVERAAKFDQRQLNQRQRLYEWKPAHKPKRQQPGNNNASARLSDAGAPSPHNPATSSMSPGRQSVHNSRSNGSPPSAERVLSPSSVAQASSNRNNSVAIAIAPAPDTGNRNKVSEEVNTTSQSTGASTDDIHANTRHAEANAMPHRHTTMRVGPMQWYFHRIGVAMCLLQCVRRIDPYGIHDILPFPVVMFLQHNTIAFLYSAGMIAFFFPLQLIQLVAFRKDTPWLRYVGRGLASFAFLVANIIPIVYGTAGYHKYGRFIFDYYVVFSALIACIVFDVYVHKVAQALQGLIDFRSKNLAPKPIIQSPPSQRPSFSIQRHTQPQSDSARSNLSNLSDQPQPSAVDAYSASAALPNEPIMPLPQQPLEGVAEDGASEASVSINSAMDSRSGQSFGRNSPRAETHINFPTLSPHAALPSAPITTTTATPNTTGTETTTAASVLGLTKEMTSSPSINSLASTGSATDNPTGSASPSGSNLQLLSMQQSDVLPPAASTDLTRPPSQGSPAIPNRSRFNSVDSSVAPNRSRLNSIDSAISVQDTPRQYAATSPSFKVDSDRAGAYAAGTTRVSLTASRRDAVAEGYKKVVQNLRRFQVLAHLIVIGGIIILAIISKRELPTANDLMNPPSADSFSTGYNLFATTILISCGLCVLLWYAYMPMGGLCPGLGSTKKRSKKRSKTQPDAHSNQNQQPHRSPSVELEARAHKG